MPSFEASQSEAWLLSALFIVGGKRAASREQVRSAKVMFGGACPLVLAGWGSACGELV